MAFITGSSGIGSLTLEQLQDLIGPSFTDSSTVDFTYSDGGNTITADVIQAGLDHGSIGGLADDDHTQYHNDTRGDIRYYQKSEHLNASAGAGDAGKPIVLDAAGHVDATMINDADVDHGSIGGLTDDDHAQYFMVTGRTNEDLTLTGTSDILWGTDAGGDIGATGANRPGKAFVKNQVEINPSADTSDFSLMARTRTNSQYGVWFENAYSSPPDTPHAPLLHLNRLTSSANNGVGISFAVDAGDYSKEHAIVSGIRTAAGGADGALAIGVRISDVARQEVARFSGTGLAMTKSSTASIIWSTDGAGNIGASGANRPDKIYAATAIIAPNGSFTVPGFSFSSSTNMGWYRSDGNTMVAAVGGAPIFIVTDNDGMKFNGDIKAGTHNTYDIGITGTRFKDAYFQGTVTAGTLVGTWLAPDGSVGSPGIAFSGDTNTGFYRPASDQVRVSCGGSEIATFSTTNVGIAIESFTIACNNSESVSGSGALKRTSTEVANSSNTATNLLDETIYAGTLVEGHNYDFMYAGRFAASADTKKLSITFGGTSIFNSGDMAITAARSWCIRGTILQLAGSNQKVMATFQVDDAAGAAVAAQYTETAKDPGADQHLILIGEQDPVGGTDIILEFSTGDYKY